MSSASTRSNVGRLNPVTASNHIQVSPNAPIHPIFPGDQVQSPIQTTQAGNLNISNGVDPLLERLITESGHGSYITDLNHLGIRSVHDLIRFALESIPPSLGVSPYPSRELPNSMLPQSDNQSQAGFPSMAGSASNSNQSRSRSDAVISSAKRRIERTQQKLYEVEELLEEDEFCEYALFVREAGNPIVNGFYSCAGRKNNRYMFTHLQNHKMAIYWDGCWRLVHDDTILYQSPLQEETESFSVNMPGWYNLNKAKNPAPCVLHVALTDEPMVFMDQQLAAHHEAGNQYDEYLQQFKIDLPIMTIDFMFRGTIGFALRTDPHTKMMDVIGIKPDGQAKDLGLHRGDTLLKINETDVSRSPDVAFPMLKENVKSGAVFSVTFLRRKYQELVINVKRAGTEACNGKYIFSELDEFDAPVFAKERDRRYVICMLDMDEHEGTSIWGIQHIEEEEEYYIGVSETQSPPNNGWERIEHFGANPAPGLEFVTLDDQYAMQSSSAPEKRQAIFAQTKRKHKNVEHKEMEDEDHSEMDDDTRTAMAGLNEAWQSQFEDNSQSARTSVARMESVNRPPSPRSTILSPRSIALKHSPFGNRNTPALTSQMLAHVGSPGYSPSQTPNPDLVSARSVYAIPDEVQTALAKYEHRLSNLQQELHKERQNRLTLTKENMTQIIELHQQEKALEKQLESSTEFFRGELAEVNQTELAIEHRKVTKESYRNSTKLSQTKKQLFQAKIKIDDLEDALEETTRQLEAERLLVAAERDREDEFDHFDIVRTELDTMELQTEIASLKATVAAKEMEIEDLQADNEKWQQAHDSIFDKMTEGQSRLAKETAEFEDAKRFYERKLSKLKDRVQDQGIQFYEYDKRLKHVAILYEQECGKELPEWRNRPKVGYGIEDIRHSLKMSMATSNSFENSRLSVVSTGSGWAQLSDFGSNNVRMQSEVLRDEDEDELDPTDLEIDSDDNCNAFGVLTPSKSNLQKDFKEEFECEEDDDGAAAFGAFDSD